MKRNSFLVVFVTLAFFLLSSEAHGQVSFTQPPTYAGFGNQFVADFNGDGKPDLLISDGTLNLGNGDGTFKTGTAVSGTPLAVADFNGDGKPDVLEQGMGTLLVLLGNGDGTFQSPTSTASSASLNALTVVDLNGDGKPDVVGMFNNALIVYLGKGDGTFASGVSYNPGSSAGVPLISVGDFNGDQKIDIALSYSGNNVPGQEVVLLGNGDGTLQAPKTSAGVLYPTYATVGDFNGDGKLDMALSAPQYCNGSCSVPASVYILLGNGDGKFQSPTVEIAGNGPLVALDLNGDGKLDIVLESSSTLGQIYIGNGDGTFSNVANYILSFPSAHGFAPPLSGIATADFNHDGKVDIAVGDNLLLGNGEGFFQGIPLGMVPTSITAAVVGVFDKTAAPGVAAISNQSVYVLHNSGNGQLSLNHTYALPEPVRGIVTADFNGDGNLDLLVVGADSSTQNWGYSVLLGNGDGSFQPPVFYPQAVQALSAGYSVVVADFNGDKKPDVAVSVNLTFGLLLGNGDGTFAAPSYVYDGGGSILAGDFNADGKLDVAAAGSSGTGLVLGNGDGTFQAATFPASLNNFVALFTADFNNDGKPDLINYAQVALGTGTGNFSVLSPLQNYTVDQVGDFNGDGIPDIVGTFVGPANIVIEPGPSVVLLGNGDGTFGSAVNVSGNALLPLDSELVADINGDGRADILFLWNFSATGIGVLLNTTPPGFGISATPTVPQTVSAGQKANFTVAVTPGTGFTGTVNLACAIAPAVTPAPTCTLSSSSVQISSGGAQSVMLTVGTTAPVTTATVPNLKFPASLTLALAVILIGLGLSFKWNRKLQPILGASILAMVALLLCAGCGGGSGGSHTTPGTPAGTYTLTVTGTSGSVSHNTTLQVIVQ